MALKTCDKKFRYFFQRINEKIFKEKNIELNSQSFNQMRKYINKLMNESKDQVSDNPSHKDRDVLELSSYSFGFIAKILFIGETVRKKLCNV